MLKHMRSDQKTHIANDTDEDLHVRLEYAGKKQDFVLPGGQYQCVVTDFRKMLTPPVTAKAYVRGANSGHVPEFEYTGEAGAGIFFDEDNQVKVIIQGRYGTCERTIPGDRSIVVRKSGRNYLMFFAKYGKIWQTE